ncbi:MAG: caspase family protein [Treponema sp.]|nr:caspase family protein [Treponema sp.]
MKRRIFIAVFFLTLIIISPGFLFAESRNALLIANAAYTNAPLSTPIQEARGLKQSLVKLGFNVTLVENADINAMEKASDELAEFLKCFK